MSTNITQSIKLFSLAELSGMFRVSVATLRRYIKDKKLKASKLGNSYYVTEENIKKFLLITENRKEDIN